MLRWVVAFCLFPMLAFGQSYFEPARGTELRRNLMAAIRPHAEWNFGRPVEFVVSDLRASGDVAYASLSPQRPGGGAIDIRTTPMYAHDQIDPEFSEGIYMHVLYQKSGDMWVAVHFSIGATDVWFSQPDFCAIWRPVIPDYCQ